MAIRGCVCAIARFGREPARWGFFNPGIWRLISKGKFDAVVVFAGYVCATFWMALAAAKFSGTAVLFGTDAHKLTPRDDKGWKRWIKRLLWPQLFRLADVVIVPFERRGGLDSLLGNRGHGRIVVTPYCVDNDWWIEQSKDVDRADVRARWRFPVMRA